MSYRKRGNSWLVDVKVGGDDNPSGQPVRERVACKGTEADAKKLEAQVRVSIMTHGKWMDPRDEKVHRGLNKLASIGDAITEAWKHPTKGWNKQSDGHRQRKRAEECAAYLGPDFPVASVSRDSFNKLAEHFAARNNSSDTIRLKLQALYRALWFAEAKGWIKARPTMDRPERGAAREFIFTPELEAEVIGYFRNVAGDEEMADLFMLAIDTGCRANELLLLAGADVDFNATSIRVVHDPSVGRRTKTAESRTVVVRGDRSLDMLRQRVAAVGRHGRVFTIKAHRVNRRMQEVRDQLGYGHVRDFNFHAARHTHLTRLAGDVPLFVIMAQAGHKVAATTQRYVKLNDTARRKAIRGIDTPKADPQADLVAALRKALIANPGLAAEVLAATQKDTLDA